MTRKRLQSILLFLVRTVLTIEIIWLVFANILLNSALGPQLINLKPEKFTLEWEKGWTLYPAHFHLVNVNVNIHTWTTDVQAHSNQATARIRLLPLLTKRLVIDDLEGDIQSANITRNVPNTPRPILKNTKPGFKIILNNWRISQLNELVFNDWYISDGDANANGTAIITIRGESKLEELNATWQSAKVQLLDSEFSDAVDTSFHGSSDWFNPRKQKGPELFKRFRGALKVNGIVGDLSPLTHLFPKAKWIEGVQGQGLVDLLLKFDQGKFTSGSLFDVDATGLHLGFLGFVAEGVGRINGYVSDDSSNTGSQVTVSFDQYSLARHNAQKKLVIGEGLHLQANSSELGPETNLDDVEIQLDMPVARFPDITVLGSNLPESLGLSITEGQAQLSGKLQARGKDQEVNGAFILSGRQLKGHFREMDFKMDMDINSNLSGKQLDNFRVELDQTEIKLFNGEFENESIAVNDKWWMTVQTPKGYAQLSTPASVEADVTLKMKDTRALIAIFAEIKEWVKYFDGILTIKDVIGAGKVAAANQKLHFQDIQIDSDKLQILAELKAEKGDRDGIFWGKRGVLSLGLEREGQETKWKIVNSREWFDQRKAEAWTDLDSNTSE